MAEVTGAGVVVVWGSLVGVHVMAARGLPGTLRIRPPVRERSGRQPAQGHYYLGVLAVSRDQGSLWMLPDNEVFSKWPRQRQEAVLNRARGTP